MTNLLKGMNWLVGACMVLAPGIFSTAAEENKLSIRYLGALPPQCAAERCAIQMIDSKSGWLYGQSAFWKTGDGGVTWMAAPAPALRLGDSVTGRFIGRSNGLFLTVSQNLYESEDGGTHWAREGLPHFEGIAQSIWWFDGGPTWLGGGEYVTSATPDAPNYAMKRDDLGNWQILEAFVFRKENAASAWVKQSLPSGALMIGQLQFWNKEQGIAIGDGAVYYTQSGGDHWERSIFRDAQVPPDDCFDGGALASIFLGSGRRGWLSTDLGCVYQTKDSGKTWSRISSPGTPHFDSFAFVGAGRGLGIARQSQLYETLDDGQTWKQVNVGFRPRSFFVLEEHMTWLTSDSGLYQIR